MCPTVNVIFFIVTVADARVFYGVFCASCSFVIVTVMEQTCKFDFFFSWGTKGSRLGLTARAVVKPAHLAREIFLLLCFPAVLAEF